ncbi:hypothetical protein GUITHDRAFT_112979 [Guillardia theta CCMP2712]|uniref:Uncharacterized protein n=1 Tax=Guillardia theta (strain CCMP2712) TaxID=905079 RepID=L1IYS2_GUITC|nr:hypothetical protein GUITHDRAFT_112979 [Guillardia theta CCMP2712]EKX40975.1 hypothetical protein GUITHDRAFT_112979 [Guillardia theta CCMP2712]|eukprot:XP_005827955.1 hypothetical protein GUITHDRAFT_112979 [Guillardia theta CCMP2712]
MSISSHEAGNDESESVSEQSNRSNQDHTDDEEGEELDEDSQRFEQLAHSKSQEADGKRSRAQLSKEFSATPSSSTLQEGSDPFNGGSPGKSRDIEEDGTSHLNTEPYTEQLKSMDLIECLRFSATQDGFYTDNTYRPAFTYLIGRLQDYLKEWDPWSKYFIRTCLRNDDAHVSELMAKVRRDGQNAKIQIWDKNWMDVSNFTDREIIDRVASMYGFSYLYLFDPPVIDEKESQRLRELQLELKVHHSATESERLNAQLWRSIEQNDIFYAKKYLERGADVNAIDSSDGMVKTLKMSSPLLCELFNTHRPLYTKLSVWDDLNVTMCRVLLLLRGAHAVVALILEYPAVVDLQDANIGKTALMILHYCALCQNHYKKTVESIMQGFEQSGKQPNFTQPDKFGMSALDLAYYQGRSFVFEYLESIAGRSGLNTVIGHDWSKPFKLFPALNVPPYVDSSDSKYDPQEPLAQELSRVARHLDENFTLEECLLEEREESNPSDWEHPSESRYRPYRTYRGIGMTVWSCAIGGCDYFDHRRFMSIDRAMLAQILIHPIRNLKPDAVAKLGKNFLRFCAKCRMAVMREMRDKQRRVDT